MTSSDRPTSLVEASQAMQTGAITSVELLERCLSRLGELEPQVHAMVAVTDDRAREQAATADRRRADGDTSPLLGIPVVLKDLIDVAGVPTTAGSRVMHDYVPDRDAPVWRRLRKAGAVLVGKANTHEFAYGGTTEPTRNPADTTRIVGGSSGGPAAALAAGYCLAGLGTDTAGSIRIPANLCGVAGLKPSRARVSAEGVVPLSPTLDCAGPMARTVADLAPLLEVIATTSPTRAQRETGQAPSRIGLVTGTGPAAASVMAAVATAADSFDSLGAKVVECQLPGFAESLLDDFTIIGAEAAFWHRRWQGRADLYTPYVRERLAEGAKVSAGDYLEALESAERLCVEVDRLLDDVDVLLLPGVPFPAPPAYDDRVLVDGVWEDRDSALCRNTAFANLTGHPALAIPAGLDGSLPVGIQLVGRRGADFDLIRIGEQLEVLLPPGLPSRLR